MPMTASTIRSSMRVKPVLRMNPPFLRLGCYECRRKAAKQRRPAGGNAALAAGGPGPFVAPRPLGRLAVKTLFLKAGCRPVVEPLLIDRLGWRVVRATMPQTRDPIG